MPVANLQSYRNVGLRVRSTAFAAQGLAMQMENAVLDKLRQACGFEAVGRADDGPAELVLDLNITNVSRGGTGWVRNENQVVVDTLLVLSDGVDGNLLGTATIHGKSSGAVINNAPQADEAVGVIAKTVGDLLAKSGCSGPRVARAPAPPDPAVATAGSGSVAIGEGSAAGSAAGTGSAAGGTPPPATADESKRAEAEALNTKGKELLFSADTKGALAMFEQANALVPDPKYKFNACVALGAQERWNEAIAACKQAKAMNPSASLTAKIDARLEALQHKQ